LQSIGFEEVIMKARNAGPKSRTRSAAPANYRRADTGRYTTAGYAKRHPKTTVRESK
jgi:hypothetical protein